MTQIGCALWVPDGAGARHPVGVTPFRRALACLFALAGAAIVTASGVDAGTTYPNLTVSPVGGQAGATFSATYTFRAGTGCGTGVKVEIHWNQPNGPMLGQPLGASSTCATTFSNSLRPPGGVAPGTYTVWALKTTKSGSEVTPPTTRASATYVVAPPRRRLHPRRRSHARRRRHPAGAATPKPKPTTTTTRATTTKTTTSTSTSALPQVAVATDPGPAPAAGPTPSDAPAPSQRAPTAAPCKGAGCPLGRLGTASPSLVATVQSLAGRSPLATLGVLLLAVACVLYVILRRSSPARPAVVAATSPAAARTVESLDPVIPDEALREIYQPPTPDPVLLTEETMVMKRRGGRPAAKAPTASTTPPPEASPPLAAAPVAEPSPPPAPAQATEDILPQGLFPISPDDTVVTNPAPATEDGLPPMAPPPPKP